MDKTSIAPTTSPSYMIGGAEGVLVMKDFAVSADIPHIASSYKRRKHDRGTTMYDKGPMARRGNDYKFLNL